MKMPPFVRSLVCSAATVLFLAGCADVEPAASVGREHSAPGKALVVFYREDHVLGSPFGFNVCDQFAKIGGLKNGSYFAYQTDPGQHYFSATTEVTNTLVMRVEAGCTYYVRGYVRPGVVAARPVLEQVSRAEGSSAIGGLEKVTLRPQPKRKY
jgi:hypothetical protein